MPRADAGLVPMQPSALPLAVSLAALGLLTVALPPGSETAQAQGSGPFEYCGDVRPIFINPDLQPQEDGFVHATGWFFIQFQVIAEDPSFEVDRLAFSFGKPIPDSLRTCDAPTWITDAYYKDYRVDDDPSDGFFIPINTTNVPDGEYGAAISVYADGEELGRGYTRAIVENGCQVRFGFDCDRDSVVPNDRVKPWPIVLPGDGEGSGSGLTLEFAEPVTDVRAFVDGTEVPLEEAEPRTWDTDSIASALDEDAPACPACEDTVWGPAFRWPGTVPEEAVVSVHARDLNDNTVSKIVHLSSSAVGGVISIQTPALQVKVPEGEATGAVGETTSFTVTFTNVGRDVAHTNLHLTPMAGIELAWEPNHVVVPTGESVTATLEARPLETGTFRIDASAVYKAGTEDVTKPVPLTLEVGEGGGLREANATANETVNDTAPGEGTNEAPGIGSPLVLLILGALAARAGRLARR